MLSAWEKRECGQVYVTPKEATIRCNYPHGGENLISFLFESHSRKTGRKITDDSLAPCFHRKWIWLEKNCPSFSNRLSDRFWYYSYLLEDCEYTDLRLQECVNHTHWCISIKLMWQTSISYCIIVKWNDNDNMAFLTLDRKKSSNIWSKYMC